MESNYEQLVAALQYCEFGWSARTCDNCEYSKTDCQLLLSDAADAIEALQAEVERLKASNEELRERQTFIDHYGTEWMTSAKDVPTAAYEHGYADGKAEERAKMQKRNAELHAELERWVSAAEKAGEPKRGEWIYKPKDAIEMMFTLPKCSICGHESSDANNYCPNCGSHMVGEKDERN